MATHDLLLARIRGECRLWHLDPVHCRAVLEGLVAEGFIHQAHDGAFTALATTRGTPAKATLSSSRRATARPSRIA